jgi:hypothetical protein
MLPIIQYVLLSKKQAAEETLTFLLGSVSEVRHDTDAGGQKLIK